MFVCYRVIWALSAQSQKIHKQIPPVGSQIRNLGTTPILKKRSRSEKAILGATLGIPGHSRSNSRNGTHEPILCENPILRATLGATLGIGWTLKFQPKFSELFFSRLGWSLRTKSPVSTVFGLWGQACNPDRPCTDPKSGLRPEMGKEWPKNGFWPHRGKGAKWPKKWEMTHFWANFPFFSAIFPPFSWWAKLHFSAFFPISGWRPAQGNRDRKERPKGPLWQKGKRTATGHVMTLVATIHFSPFTPIPSSFTSRFFSAARRLVHLENPTL